MNFETLLAAKARSFGVQPQAIMAVLARKLVEGEIDMEDDQVTILLALSAEDLADEG